MLLLNYTQSWDFLSGVSTATKILFMYFGNLGISRPQSQFPHSCVCERFLYSQYCSTYFLWPRNSFSGNICFEFSVLVLCSELSFWPFMVTAAAYCKKMHNSKTVPLKRTDRVLHNGRKSWVGRGACLCSVPPTARLLIGVTPSPHRIPYPHLTHPFLSMNTL